MLKSSIRKGFTLIEVLCSLAIFSIIFICIISCELSALNMKKSIKAMNANVLIMETLKNNIIYSMTYSELVMLKDNKSFYVHKDNLSLDKFKGKLVNTFTVNKPIVEPYIELSFLQCEYEVYHLKIALHSKETNDRFKLQCDFYKGKHR
jgi:prepilin-type N-terminal cleavage/methylation domain-containing protein